MRKIHSQGVPYFEHPAASPSDDLSWDAIRIFLSVHRQKSFRRSAAELGVAVNTLRRQIELLERQLGGPLLTRHVSGIRLTAEGVRLVDAAMAMEAASFGVRRQAQGSLAALSGRVTISVTEGIGTFWLMPRLVEFQRANPKLIVELNCTMRPPDVLRLEADIGIQLKKPENPDLKVIRLGRMHVMPFASTDYLDLYGRPATLQDVRQHKIVEQLSPQIDINAVDALFPDVPREGFVAVATNTSTAHYWAVARGAGIGMLPTYLPAIGARVEPVDLDLRLHHDIWMAFHPDARRTKRVAAAIDWVKLCFDPKRFPWFRDDFIHPSNLAGIAKQAAPVNLFDGIVAR